MSANTEPEQFSLLPPPEFNPTWPERGTKPYAALQSLLNGERINQITFGLIRGWRLSGYIKELEYLGWQVKREWTKVPEYPREIKSYWLSNDAIAAARSMRGAA